MNFNPFYKRLHKKYHQRVIIETFRSPSKTAQKIDRKKIAIIKSAAEKNRNRNDAKI
jgi:hypothetical protein